MLRVARCAHRTRRLIILACLALAMLPGGALLQPVGRAEGDPSAALAVGPNGFEPSARPAAGLRLEPRRAARIGQIIPDVDAACLPVDGDGLAGPAQIAIGRMTAAVRTSPLGGWLLEQAAWRGVLICFDPATELAAYYRAQLHLIGIQPELSDAGRVVFLAHELAHVPQHPWYSNNRTFAPRDMMLIHRMREAVAEAIATRVLWQMRERGLPLPFAHKLETGYGDIARAFLAVIEAHPDAPARELLATRAAFDRWFAFEPRRRHYDAHMLDHIERIAGDRLGLIPPRRRASEDYLRAMTWYAGESFLAGDDVRRLTDDPYAGGIADENAARLDAILEPAAWPLRRAGPYRAG